MLTLALVQLAAASLGTAQESAWKDADVPASWKKLSGGAYGDRKGFSWFRCVVRVPEAWKGQSLELFAESVDDAREFYFNGVQVGRLGSMPPLYRSGLGQVVRYRIDAEHVRYGQDNLLSIRVCQRQSRGNFNVAAPVLFGAEQAIRTQGRWQTRSGDDLAWSRLDQISSVATHRFSKLEDADEVVRTLRKLSDEEGPQTVAEALKKMKVAEDLALDVALADPHIGQPLSVKFDERGRMWVAQYLQYPEPAGLKMVSRDKYLRTVYDKVPPAPPNHFPGRDKISIHEDTNGDGKFDQHKTFVEGLSLATSFTWGKDGVWVLNPPYLLFYPDRDHDDVPDGDPEVHLEGFGIEDSHSIASNLDWGPDGWLYACQGSTVTGNIRRPGSKEKPVFSMGQLIWRYHPEMRRYEIFAEGGGNAFGLEIDAKGRIYSGHNGGDTRGFHYVQGGYYRKGFGKHGALSNPYSFGYFEAMAHPRVPRFTHSFVIYEADNLPKPYAGRLFGVAPLQGHVVMSKVSPDRSSFKTTDEGRPLTSEDPWFRPVAITVGPDGAIYVADMYEQRIDHASHYQGRIHRESGRIYRIRAKDRAAYPPVELASLSTKNLIERLADANKWTRRTALRLIANRADPSSFKPLRELLKHGDEQSSLEALWALHLVGQFDEATITQGLHHPVPDVRLWTVRLLCDQRSVSPKVATMLADLAERELNVHVRSQLACSARRLSAKQSLPIVVNLTAHSEDADDIHVPLLLWWALEDKAESDRELLLEAFSDAKIWKRRIVREHLQERLMRRYAQAGGRRDLLSCARLLNAAPEMEDAKRLLAGFEKGISGRTLSGVPGELGQALARVGGGSLALRVQQLDSKAIEQALQVIANEKADRSERRQLVQIFAAVQEPKCIPTLLEVVSTSKDEEIRSAALTTLGSYDDEQIGPSIVQRLAKLPPTVREVAQTTLASRSAWARTLVEAVDKKEVEANSVPRDVLRKIMLHPDKRIAELVRRNWGELPNATTAEMRSEIQRLTQLLKNGSGDPYSGKKLFAANCGKCHVLFGQGGYVGPDLTSYQRSDLGRVLVNVVNPSIEIREGFENYVALTEDGRVVSGFITDQDNRVVVLRSVDGQNVVVPREELEELRAVKQSIMPEGVLKPLSDQQLRDLFAYLRASQPLP